MRTLKFILVAACMVFAFSCNCAAKASVLSIDEDTIDNQLVEVPAMYPGGEAGLLRDVYRNLVYPKIAQEQELEGTVVLHFRVNKKGKIDKIIIKEGLSKECDQACVEVVKKLKMFTPARNRGKRVPVWFTLPIQFRIM